VSIYPEDDEILFDDSDEDFEEEEERKLSLAGKLIILLLVLALVGTLMWPLFYQRVYRQPAVPTPTPSVLLEA
jgi:hypothetical protein